MSFSGCGNQPCPIASPLGVIDIWNREHQDWLLWWADWRGLSLSELDRFGELIHGEESGALERCLNAVRPRTTTATTQRSGNRPWMAQRASQGPQAAPRRSVAPRRPRPF